jgi:hypothetical protein
MSDVDTATRPAGASRLARVRMASFGAVTMLIIQFILGMIAFAVSLTCYVVILMTASPAPSSS